jgi:hypothetical protein
VCAPRARICEGSMGWFAYQAWGSSPTHHHLHRMWVLGVTGNIAPRRLPSCAEGQRLR